MLIMHRGLGTYRHRVTRYIALNEFSRQKFIAGGLPADKVVVKPNFVDWAAPPAPPQTSEGAAAERTFLLVGRLSPEKGIAVLGQAMRQLPEVRLRVAGEGSDAPLLRGLNGVTLLGPLLGEKVYDEMTQALALVLPSVCYENFPRTLVEAFASGLPVIASRLGAMAELIHDGETGLLFEPGNPADLAARLRWALQHPDEMRAMGGNARREYEAKYTPEINYRQLVAIYEEAISEEHHHSR
jgi:glycosyltransferase involved in cell wall biosynthesis